MSFWWLLPIPGVAIFLAAAIAAGTRGGEPRGRTALVCAGLSGAVLLAAVGWILTEPSLARLALAMAIANGALLLALPAWSALVVRFGTPRGQDGGWKLLVPAALLVDLALIVSGAMRVDPTQLESVGSQTPMLLQGTAARAVAGAFLLLGAVGVLRAQSLWEVARLEQQEQARRAFSGLVLTYLGLFLCSAQALLYGAVSLQILAVITLLFVPAVGALIPLLRPRASTTCPISAEARPVISSAVLIGLGGFLIVLAAVGEFMSRFAPAGRVLWFQWGGSILIGGYGALWLIPGLRRRFRRWLQVPELGRTYQWAVSPLLERVQLTGDGPVLLLLSALFEEPIGRPAIALWLRSADGMLTPCSSSGSRLGRVPADNPMIQVLRRERSVLDLSRPPHRLALVPAYVENLDLIEQSGFRLFLALRAGPEDFGLLAVAPRDPARTPDDALLLDLYRGELSILAWGALVAWNSTPAGPEDRSHYERAAELLHKVAEGITHRAIAPRFAARLAAAAEEVAHQLTTRAKSLTRPSGEGAEHAGSSGDPVVDEVRA